MMEVSALISALIKAGTPAELVGEVAHALSTREPVVVNIPDASAEVRRQRDRDRKAEIRRNLRKSAEIHATPHIEEIPLSTTSENIQQEEKKDISVPAAKNPRTAKESRGTRLNTDWVPTEADIAYALNKGLDRGRIADQAERFRDYYLAKSGEGGCKRDWGAAWRTWVQNAITRGFNVRSSNASPARSGPREGAFATIILDELAAERFAGGHGIPAGDADYRGSSGRFDDESRSDRGLFDRQQADALGGANRNVVELISGKRGW